MNYNWKKRSVLFFVLLFLVWVFYYIFSNQQDFLVLNQISFSDVALIGICYLPSLYLLSLLNQLLFRKLNIHISMLESLSLCNLTSIFNYAVPIRGGAAFRAFYLNTYHQVSYSYFIGSLAVTSFIIIFVISFVGIISQGVLWIQFDLIDWFSLVIFASFILLFIIVMILKINPLSHFQIQNGFLKKVDRVFKSCEMIRKDRSLVGLIILISILKVLIGAFITYLCFNAISNPIEYSKILHLACISNFTTLLSITPGAIGVQEGIMMFVGKTLAISQADILMVSFINRMAFLVINTLLIPPSLYTLFGKDWGKQLLSIIRSTQEESRK